MKKISLIEIFETFSKKEMNEFEKYITSPFFTTAFKVSPDSLKRLFLEFKKRHSDLSSEKLTKQYFFTLIFPGRDYNDGVMRNLTSALLRLAENYLSYSLFKNDINENKKYLLLNLHKRKLDNLFEHHKKFAFKALEDDNINISYFYHKQLLHAIENDFCKLRKKHYSLQKELNFFHYHYIAKSLDIYRNMATEENIMNEKFDFIYMNNVLGYLKHSPDLLNKFPSIALLYYELLLVLYSDKKYYTKLKQLKERYIDKMDIMTLYSVYTCLLGFCIKMNNSGQQGYHKESFKLYIEILDKNIHSITPYMPLYFFLSAVINSLDLGEYLWAENFIEKYKSHLDPLHYDYAVNYCYAELHFAKKQYDKAIQNLSKINIELSQQKQQLKNLMIKIYYESGLFEETIYLIDSSKHFLSRELQLTKSTKTSYLKFINFTSSLLKAKMNAIPDKVIHLRNKIHKEKYFKNKPWLIEKISELM